MPDELFFAVSTTSASLYTRRGRPLYATRAQWEKWSDGLPAAAYVSAMARSATGTERLIFGALPLDETGNGTDLIDTVLKAISNLTAEDLFRLTGYSEPMKASDWVGGVIPPVCQTCGSQHVGTCPNETGQ